ncbi:MAG: DUF3347 domain-containing protein [Chitinophagaceae bacterium]|jgi:hypothetical protein|nr:DUF3347 domain-containing protein [Chitinophagaceae bacterium]
MKKGLVIIGIAIVAIAVYFIFFGKKTENGGNEDKPLAISKNSDSFNIPVGNLLQVYSRLHDAFVNWDSANAALIADSVATAANSIPLNTMKADSALTLTAKTYIGNIVAECKGIQGDKNIEEQRRSFNILSDNLFDFIRTVRYDKAAIYRIKCPMAFNDSEEGYWLSETSAIINPYLGNKHPHYKGGMINCGEVVDSVYFTN